MSELKLSMAEIFAQTRQTYKEDEAKRASERISAKIERFRTADDGEYKVRILPLVPNILDDGTVEKMERKGFEYPVLQQFIKIKVPKKGSKGGKNDSFINIPIIKATQKGVGLPVDIIDTYVKIAKEFDDFDVIEKITSNSFSGGLKWNYVHAMYVLDLNKNRKGPLLYQCSASQYHSIDDTKKDIWDQLRESQPDREDCDPLSDFTLAYPLGIKRTTENRKTEYSFSIKALGATDPLSENELKALLDAPRIPDEIYRYTRYQFEATLVFLKQYDEKLELNVCEEDDFKEAVEQLRAALSPDDTSHFNIDNVGKDKEGSAKTDEITLNSLFDELDAIAEAPRTSDEYNELREKITQFVQDNELDIRISHSKSNSQLLDEIEELMSNDKQASIDNSSKEEAPEEEEAKPVTHHRSRPVKEEPKDEEQEEAPEEEQSAGDPEPEKEPERPARRQRPSDDEEEKANDNGSSEEAPVDDTPAEGTVRRRRRR